MMTKPKSQKRQALPALDPSQTLAFKRFFHGNGPAWFQFVPEPKGSSTTPRSVFGTVKKLRAELRDANANGCGVFMAINSMTRVGRGKDNVKRINAVFLDSDGQLDIAAIRKLDPVPHLVVRTSKGHYHVYWRVKNLPVIKFSAMQKALAARFGTDRAVSDASRVMRVPGTLHLKAEPALAKVVLQNIDARALKYEKLVAAFELDLKEVAADREPQEVGDTEAEVAEMRGALLAIPPAYDRETWLKVGMAIHSALPNEIGWALWTEWSRLAGDKFDAQDQRKNWRSFCAGGGVTRASLFALAKEHGWTGDRAKQRDLPADQFGLVDEFAKRADQLLCFEPGGKKWLVFNQPVWVDDDARVIEVARSIFEGMRAHARGAGDPTYKRLVESVANVSGVRGLLRDASSTPALNARLDDFDRQPHLLAVANGVVNLLDGSFRPGLPEDRLIRMAPATFDPGAKCQRFEEFIAFATRNRLKYAEFLQRALGYTLFGHTNEQVLFVVIGDSGNGKGTLFRAILHVLGPFVTAIAPNLLSKAYSGNPQSPTPAIMALHGARMYQCGEGEDRHRFDAAFVKQLSGSDLLTGRGNFSDQSQFIPVGKLWLSANDLPEVAQQDEAMWRRILVLPFDAKVENRDGAYEDKLREEASGILNWLIQGALAYGHDRLGHCKVVTKATEKARKSGDSVAAWITEACKVCEDSRVQSSQAYASYSKFCRTQGATPLPVQRFSRAMGAKGHHNVSTKRWNAFTGLELRD